MGTRRVIEVVGSLAVGGAERVALEVAAGVREHGIETEIVCAASSAEPKTAYEKGLRAEAESRGVPVSYVVFPSFFDRSARRTLREHLEARGADLVHIHNRPQDWQTVAVARLAGIPAFYTVHLTYPPGSSKQQALYVAAGRIVPKVVCVSNAVADYAREYEKVPESKLQVIYNGIRMHVYAPPTAEVRREKRRELGWAEDDFVFFSAARLSDQKGHSFSIDAFARLAPESRAKLFIAGEGPKQGDLEAQIARLGLKDRVTLLGARRDVPAILGAADAYLSASLQEGHPLSLLEAMAVELPVVAPRLPSIVEIAMKGTPLLYGPKKSGNPDGHDPDHIAQALSETMNDIDGFRERAKSARAEVAEKYSLDAMIRQHAELYETLISNRRPSRIAGIGKRFFV